MVLLYNRPGGHDEREGVAPFSLYLSHFLTPISKERVAPFSPYLSHFLTPISGERLLLSPPISLTTLPQSLEIGCSFLPISLSYFLTPISGEGMLLSPPISLLLSHPYHFFTFYLRGKGLLLSPLTLSLSYLLSQERRCAPLSPSDSLTFVPSISGKKGCSCLTL